MQIYFSCPIHPMAEGMGFLGRFRKSRKLHCYFVRMACACDKNIEIRSGPHLKH